jgi:hypothetical protein
MNDTSPANSTPLIVDYYDSINDGPLTGFGVVDLPARPTKNEFINHSRSKCIMERSVSQFVEKVL